MVTFPEENFPSVFPHVVAEGWREVDEAGSREAVYTYILNIYDGVWLGFMAYQPL